MSIVKSPIRFNVGPQEQEKEGYEIHGYTNNYYLDKDYRVRLKRDDEIIPYIIPLSSTFIGFVVMLTTDKNEYKIQPVLNLIANTVLHATQEPEGNYLTAKDGNPYNFHPDNIAYLSQATHDAIMEANKPQLYPEELVDIYTLDTYKRVIRKKSKVPMFLAVSIIGLQEEKIRYIMNYSNSVKENYPINGKYVVVKADSRLYDNIEYVSLSQQVYYVWSAKTNKARRYTGFEELATIFRRKKADIEDTIKDFIKQNKKDKPVLEDKDSNGGVKHQLWLPEHYTGNVESDSNI